MNIGSVVHASPNQVSCELEGEQVMLNLQNGTYYGLDSVGSFIWKLIDQPKTVATVRDAVLETYEVDADQCERDLFNLLEKLLSEGLIEITENSENG